MCTVSFFKDKERVIITSNRDENIQRPLALPPTRLIINNQPIYCPIDPVHQGTWFAVNPKGRVLVLLNGAEEKHIPMPPYKKSRGLVLIDLVSSEDFHNKWNSVDLNKIENFTLVFFEKNTLFQFQWNGEEKSQIPLDPTKPHIWSSTTLYDEKTIDQRKNWYFDFLKSKNNLVSANDLLTFHTQTKKEDQFNGLIINRNQKMLTKNITQAVLFNNHFSLNHHDLLTNNFSLIEEPFHEDLVE